MELVNICAPLIVCLGYPWYNCSSICHISAKNEAMHAVNIQEVTSLADSYDSPVIFAAVEVSAL